MSIVTRFAPSPTGNLHIGGVRTALMNYLFAKKMGGIFLLRIEDTDTERSKKEYEEGILSAFSWLDMESMGPILRQSERTEIYKSYIEQLINNGHAYISQEEGGEGKRSEVIRFKNPGTTITFNDIVRGEVSVDTSDLGDFIIARSITEPVYHLAVVIDDVESKVTHVIRASEHLSNTPRQILIQRAIGAPQPVYAHIPLILGSDGKKKLSKRDGATSIDDYRNQGYLPEALINYLALLGWHPSESDQEIFTRNELISAFELEQVQKGGAQFDTEKLSWINREHLLKLSEETFSQKVFEWIPSSLRELPEWSDERLAKALPLIRERISIFKDIQTMADEGEFDYIGQPPHLDISKLYWKKSTPELARQHLVVLRDLLANIPESASTKDLEDIIMPYAEEQGKGDVLWPLRYALSGREKSPGPFEIAGIIGASSVRSRIDTAINLLNE